MSKKVILLIIMSIIILFSGTVYGIMLKQYDRNTLNFEVINNKKVVSVITDERIFEKTKESEYITEKFGLEEGVAAYLVEQCQEKKIDLFLVLGLIRTESNFNTMVVGTQGERGLGQLMENTAKPLAKNLGIEYDPEKLFEPKYNIKLFMTQLKYLNDILDNDLHKVLTAYNRGEYGLKRYMTSREGIRNPAQSSYSSKVLKYAYEYRAQFKE